MYFAWSDRLLLCCFKIYGAFGDSSEEEFRDLPGDLPCNLNSCSFLSKPCLSTRTRVCFTSLNTSPSHNTLSKIQPPSAVKRSRLPRHIHIGTWPKKTAPVVSDPSTLHSSSPEPLSPGVPKQVGRAQVDLRAKPHLRRCVGVSRPPKEASRRFGDGRRIDQRVWWLNWGRPTS